MNIASASQLSAGHLQLQLLAGAWRGEEQVGASQWTAAGTAVGEVASEVEFGGLFIVQHYRQLRDGKISFQSHNVFGCDQTDGTCKLYQFDSMGFVPTAPASGSWEGDTLTLERSSARGKARIRYAFADTDSYRMTLQFQPAGSDAWQDMVDGIYRRVAPDQINFSQKAF
jgi:hypothetical protein